MRVVARTAVGRVRGARFTDTSVDDSRRRELARKRKPKQKTLTFESRCRVSKRRDHAVLTRVNIYSTVLFDSVEVRGQVAHRDETISSGANLLETGRFGSSSSRG